MKRMILALLLLAAAGCAKNDGALRKAIPTGPITISATVKKMPDATRGNPLDNAGEIADLGLFCYYTGTADLEFATMGNGYPFNYIVNQRMVQSGGAWDYADGASFVWKTDEGASIDDRYSFVAYSPYTDVQFDGKTYSENGLSVDKNSGWVVGYYAPQDVTMHPDLMFNDGGILNVKPTAAAVPITMKHALTAVGFEVMGAGGERITEIAISGMIAMGDLYMMKVVSDFSGGVVWSAGYLPDVVEHRSAGLKFDPGQSYVTATTTMTPVTADNGWLMLPPQEFPAESAAQIEVSFIDPMFGVVLTRAFPMAGFDPWVMGDRVIYKIDLTAK